MSTHHRGSDPTDGDEKEGSHQGFSTRAIHAGQEPDPLTGAVVTPIHLASTFAQQAVGEHKGFDYSRTRNPTRVSLETTIAALEGANHGIAFASGMAAVDAVLRLLHPGDHVIIPNDAYGGTYRLVASLYAGSGVSFTAVELQSTAAVEAASPRWSCEAPRRCRRPGETRPASSGWRRRATRSCTSSTSRR
jgi:cystathionine beta-lyase/cystathionine gamma-synthase